MDGNLGNFDRIEEMFFIQKALAKVENKEARGKLSKGFAIGRMTTLEEYNKEKGTGEKEITTQEQEKKSGLMIIPLTLGNGEKVNIVVNSKAEEIACEFRDIDGNVQKVELSEMAKGEILTALHENFKLDQAKEAVHPNTLEDLERTITEENIDLGKEQDQKVVKEKEHISPEEAKAQTEVKEKIEEEVPEDVKDAVAAFYAREGKIEGTIRVRKVSARDMNEKIRKSEINPNDPDMYLFEIPGGRSGKVDSTRMVLVSPDGKTYDSEEYDKALSGYIREHGIENSGLNSTSPKKGKDDYISYTDFQGNVTIQALNKSPNDLSAEEKAKLQAEFEALDKEQDTILNDSDLTPERKGEELLKTNREIKDLFLRYGMEVPSSIEEEIDADSRDAEEIENEEPVEETTPELEEDDHYPDDHSQGRIPPWLSGRNNMFS